MNSPLSNTTAIPATEPHLLQRIRFQVLSGLVIAVLLPQILRLNTNFFGPLFGGIDYSVAATAVALLVGYYFYRRLTVYPGVISAAYIIPVFSIAYGSVFLLFLFMRFDYSRFQFGASYLFAIAWFYGIYFFSRRLKPYQFAILPGGQVESIKQIDSAQWSSLDESKTNNAGQIINRYAGIVADLRHDFDDESQRFIADCAVSGVPVFHYKQLREALSGKVEIEHFSENPLGTLLPNLAYMKLKQLVDIAVSLLLLPILLPVFAVIALLIRRDSEGPVFFVQERMGFRGQPFNCYKFRTMRVAREDDKVEDALEAAKTQAGDARITKLGAFLRKTRLDEFPQIINVLRGEMSWIGPRPEAMVLSELYEEKLPFYRYRHVVRPGITGWAQVNLGHVAEVEDVGEKLNYDFYYIKNFSPWLDFLIVFKTVRTMLTGSGAK